LDSIFNQVLALRNSGTYYFGTPFTLNYNHFTFIAKAIFGPYLPLIVHMKVVGKLPKISGKRFKKTVSRTKEISF